jgi:hypothetical protein
VKMLDLYRSVYHFIACINAADDGAETKSDMRFVLDMRWRYSREHPKMKMTAKEWRRLTMLAIEGGWDGCPLEPENQICA